MNFCRFKLLRNSMIKISGQNQNQFLFLTWRFLHSDSLIGKCWLEIQTTTWWTSNSMPSICYTMWLFGSMKFYSSRKHWIRYMSSSRFLPLTIDLLSTEINLTSCLLPKIYYQSVPNQFNRMRVITLESC
jgi:hypothetical protein